MKQARQAGKSGKLLTTLLMAALAASTACSNANVGGGKKARATVSTKSPTAPTGGTGTTQSLPTYVISSVAPDTASATPTALVKFDGAVSAASFKDVCSSVAQGGAPCQCVYSWEYVNPNSGGSALPNHTVRKTITNVQEKLVVCPLPEAFTNETELPTGTTVSLSIQPAEGNPRKFNVAAKAFTKGGASSDDEGSFQDAEGRAFTNIQRYSCFERNLRGMEVRSRRFKITLDQARAEATTFELITASQFCVAKADGSGGDPEQCPGLSGPQLSAQSNYYNLYTRSTELGAINQSNKRFTCPKIVETLDKNAAAGPSSDFWPLDATFALKLSPDKDFPIGVEAFTKVSSEGDGGSQGSTCFGGAVAIGDSNSLVPGCLGFAARPQPDGTCSPIKDKDGKLKPTFRLRRFIALHPPGFDSDGRMLGEPQSSDTIYVLDRPVLGGGGTPEKPVTMLGPKPCPYAYFDHKGQITTDDAYKDSIKASGGRPGYFATSDARWNNRNVDGIELPNRDISRQSCSAVLPVLSEDRTTYSLATINAGNTSGLKSVPIRPIRPWLPHYEEDSDFQACAPQADQLKDAPLHFSKDAKGNVAWCAEAYPTQNPMVRDVDRAPNGSVPGRVQTFTSHVVKNANGNSCSATTLTATGGATDRTPSAIVNAIIPSTYPTTQTGGSCTKSGTILTGAARHPARLWVDSTRKGSAACTPGGTETETGTCNFCANVTCDRTVLNANTDSSVYPLLAPAPQVEAALRKDSSYTCSITQDRGGGTKGKNRETPTQGCCGAPVKVSSGSSELDAAHLEPGTPCEIPAY